MKHTLLLLSMLLAFSTHAQDPGTIKWKYETGDDLYGSPAIGSDGTIYIGSKNNKLYAINHDGTLKWSYETVGTIKASPAIGSDGTIYFGSFMSKFYALKPDGTLKWDYSVGIINDNSPAIASDGTVYQPSSDGLYAFKPDGTLKWKYDHNNNYSTPAIALDGTIYFGVYDDFYALNPNGTVKWKIRIGNIESSPAIGSDGTIYVGSKDHNVYALNPDGTVKWKYKTGGLIIASPVIDKNGVIYIGSYDKKFHAINSDGSQKWVHESSLEFYRTSAAAVGDNGVIYVFASDPAAFYIHKLYAFNPDGTIKWESNYEKNLDTPISIGDDGIIYIGTYEGDLLAVNSACTGLANSPWPKFRNNNSGTGLASITTSIQKTGYERAKMLDQNYPNPFNNKTRISFKLTESGNVSLKVYNILGAEVAVLINGNLPAGPHSIEFDALVQNMSHENGIYFYKLQCGNKVDVKTMIKK